MIMRILIVDDELLARRNISERLSEYPNFAVVAKA
jgi:DNA-binding NarL/FixJ family response regulator